MNRLFWATLVAMAGCAKTRPPVEDVAAMATASVAPTATAAPTGAPAEAASASSDEDPSAPFTAEVDDEATLRIEYKGARLATFKYLFWGEKFSWADAVLGNVKTQAGVTTFELGVKALGLTIQGKIEKASPNELAVEYVVRAEKALHGVTGGGLEWSLNLDARTPEKADPALLPGRQGFRWGVAKPPEGLTVSFDPPLPAVFFEQNQKGVVRCYLVGSDIAKGTQKLSMRVRLPKGGAVRRSIAERYGTDDKSHWYPETVAWNRWPIDIGFLNDKPAGRHGRLKATGDRLVFEDGTQARFWGTNVQAYALFRGSKDEIQNQARRLSALGFNLVRIHHHDSDWVKPNVIDASGGTTQKLDEAALDNLDWWIKCLEDEGIYVWLDLHVGRHFGPADAIEGYPELEKQEGSGKGFNYVNPRIEKLMQDFADKYITRQNRYSGKKYVSDPGIAFALVTNENDLIHHFGPSLNGDKGNPLHARLLDGKLKEFGRRSGLSGLSSSKAWELGPAKIALNDIEHGFDRRAIDRLRSDGLEALVATTSFWGEEALYNLPALATGDVIDVHSYGKSELLSVNPHDEANLVDWIGAAQVAGKPLSISEWNVEYPNRDRFVAPLYVASIAALQGWDAPMLYGYVQSPIEAPEKVDAWSAWNDPALLASMPAAALLFRQGHVAEAKKTYRLDLSKKALYYSATSPATSVAIRSLVEQSKLTIGLCDVPELGWDSSLSKSDADAVVTSDVDHDFLPRDQTFVESDTGELRRDFSRGVETIDTPRTQAVLGWVGKTTFRLHDVTFDLVTPKATVAVTSLDGQPIAQSQKLLLTVVAQASASTPDKALPFLAQPIEGSISIRNAHTLRMVALSPKANPGGTSHDELPTVRPVNSQGRQVFRIGPGTPTHWFLLEP